MKSVTWLVALCLMLTPGIASASYSLPILDPGFELTGWNWGSGWGGYGWGGTTTSYSGDPDHATIVRTPNQSLEMVLSAPANPGDWIDESYVATQNVALTGAAGLLLNYTAWMNITSVSNAKAYLEVAFKDISGGSLGNVTGPELTATTGGWISNTLSAGIPSGTASADFNIVTYGGSWDSANNITAYFDDVSAEVIPEPTSLLLLGCGLFGLLVYNRKKR